MTTPYITKTTSGKHTTLRNRRQKQKQKNEQNFQEENPGRYLQTGDHDMKHTRRIAPINTLQ
jgi:hypothetical protein